MDSPIDLSGKVGSRAGGLVGATQVSASDGGRRLGFVIDGLTQMPAVECDPIGWLVCVIGGTAAR